MEFIHQDTQQWMPVHCKPRCEKKAHEYCQRFGITSYLPLIKSVKKYESKTAIHTKPLLPGYLFVQADQDGLRKLYQSQKVVHAVSLNDIEEEGLIHDLKNLQDFLEAVNDDESSLVVCPEVIEGSRVTITEGAFKGIEGIVEKRQDKCRVFVNISMISYSIAAEVDISAIKLSL